MHHWLKFCLFDCLNYNFKLFIFLSNEQVLSPINAVDVFTQLLQLIQLKRIITLKVSHLLLLKW